MELFNFYTLPKQLRSLRTLVKRLNKQRKTSISDQIRLAIDFYLKEKPWTKK